MQQANVGLVDAGGEPFVTLCEPIGLRRLTDDLCARAGSTPRIAVVPGPDS